MRNRRFRLHHSRHPRLYQLPPLRSLERREEVHRFLGLWYMGGEARMHRYLEDQAARVAEISAQVLVRHASYSSRQLPWWADASYLPRHHQGLRHYASPQRPDTISPVSRSVLFEVNFNISFSTGTQYVRDWRLAFEVDLVLKPKPKSPGVDDLVIDFKSKSALELRYCV
jgi:hypothetical protein